MVECVGNEYVEDYSSRAIYKHKDVPTAVDKRAECPEGNCKQQPLRMPCHKSEENKASAAAIEAEPTEQRIVVLWLCEISECHDDYKREIYEIYRSKSHIVSECVCI